MKNVFIYRLQNPTAKSDVSKNTNKMEIRKWKPGFVSFIPPNSSFSYVYFWTMHYLGLFKSNNYCAYVMLDEQKPVCSLVCVPSLYRWSFMKSDDMQIKNVFTLPKHRGKGYANTLLQHAIMDLDNGQREYWYMTDEENIPSQKLCQKNGFEYVGRYQRERSRFVYKGEIVQG